MAAVDGDVLASVGAVEGIVGETIEDDGDEMREYVEEVGS